MNQPKDKRVGSLSFSRSSNRESMDTQKTDTDWGYYLSNRETLIAAVVTRAEAVPGVEFITSQEQFMQFAIMNRPGGEEIRAHSHLSRQRSVTNTQEVLIILRGRLRVDFYDEQSNYLVSDVLGKGDAVALFAGGHGFQVLEESQFFEVKQGPFIPALDKLPIAPVSATKLKMISK